MTFPKHVTVDLKRKYNLTDLRVHNSALGGTKTVEVQVSQDGKEFKTLGKTEFKNNTADAFELANLSAQGVTHVRLVFPHVHDTSHQKKANGFVFLRELEIQGTPAQ
ncbi:MAG: discoidin domain-containing protein [Betaproteobacteria bacterium]|nr:discoidin domain-containing protein [Betaproteobacteria bacterium]